MKELSKGIRGKALKIVLLIIFCLYTSSITFFTHSHIVNGVTIVHSHFYLADDEGNPTHEHSGAEIQLIQHLSTYFVFGLIAAAIILGWLTLRATTLFVNQDCIYKQNLYQKYFRLRAPPVL